MGLFGGDKVKESKGEKKLRKVSKAQWKDYKARYAPLEAEYINKVRSLEKETPLAVSRAVADTAQAYDPVRKKREAGLMSRGVNPNSGRFGAEMQDLGLRKADTQAKGTNAAQQDSQNRFLSGMMKAVKTGRDIADSANLGFRANAENTAYMARQEAAQSQAEWEQNSDLLGTVAGGATRAYGGEIASGLKNAWNVGSTFATQAGTGSWGDPLAGPRQRS